jgi:Skp family chaperone for outer membrane proteins
MKVGNLLLVCGAFIAFASAASAQAPAAGQPTPAKVGVINSDMFSAKTGGITRLVNALRTLETEFKPQRDEIAQMVTRFNALQQPLPANSTAQQQATRRDEVLNLQTTINRKQEDARSAFAKRSAALTEPIRLSIFSALQAYSKQRGVDLLVDISKFQDGVLLLNPAADMTAAFIKDYNSKNP